MTGATIGSALVERRQKLGLSRVRAADQIGMSRTTYSSYEHDTQRPSVDVIPVLAGFLDISIDDFLILYGATSVAAVRPSLERVLHEGQNAALEMSTSTPSSEPPLTSTSVTQALPVNSDRPRPPIPEKAVKEKKKKKKHKRNKG